MSFCDHCDGQRYDRAQVLRALRQTRRTLKQQEHDRRADNVLAIAIQIVQNLEIPHLEPVDESVVH